jgi:hypothetical protein
MTTCSLAQYAGQEKAPRHVEPLHVLASGLPVQYDTQISNVQCLSGIDHVLSTHAVDALG